jgi:hypothetical protein
MLNLASLWASSAADLIRLEILAPLGLGLGCALLAFLFGGMLFGRRPQPAPPTAEESPEDEERSDRRVAMRRRGNPVVVHLARGTRVFADALVVDRSVGGLCLNAGVMIEPGTVLNVKPSDASGTLPWTEIEVRSCRQDGAEWQIGCQFVRTPPWSVRMLFG